MINRLIYVVVSLIFGTAIMAGAPSPQNVTWTTSVEKVSDTSGVLVISAKIESGWHIYGNDMPQIDDMPTYPTTVKVNSQTGLVLDGIAEPTQPASKHFDQMMNLELPWWEGEVTFRQKFYLDGIKGADITGSISYMACTNVACTPPTTEDFSVKFGEPVQAVASHQPTDKEDGATGSGAIVQDDASALNELWEPVEAPVAQTENSSFWMIFVMGFLGGLLALLTPCVWPMIPMTVSFFLKTSKVRRKAITNAIVYGISIVAIFLTLGLAITLIFDAGKLNDIATSAVFNILFFLLLVVFAISFFGAFDIKLPSKWSNAIDNKAESTTGYLSIFFMAFTLVLVSFSCTGPIIGTLLVEAYAEGSIAGPALGMGGFSLGLALPFALFAIYSSALQSMQK